MPFGVEGQARAVAFLERAIESDRIGSAYLFEGPSGVGKERAARAFAAEAIANGDAALRQRALEGNHPDLRVFGPREEGRGNIKVELVRSEILPFTQFAPFEADHAFLIFPDADISFPEWQPEAANALLKTLEEPKRGLHFLLIASRPDRLLPTIRSRCQRLAFERLSPALLEAILREADVPEADRGPAIALADGRADRALALAFDGRARLLFDLALSVDEAALARRPGLLLERAEELAGDPDVPLALEALATFYRDLACLTAGAEGVALRFAHARSALIEHAARRSLDAAIRAEGLVQSTATALERQANAQIALDALLYGLAGLR